MAAIEQAIHVKGQVVDSTGEPVIGANIVVKGTNTGVISDIDGNFAIDAPKNSVLLISFIGYKSQEVKLTGPSVKIVLTDDAEMLNEVVVVGYGSQKKSDITGAMVNVKSEALQQAPVGNIGTALQVLLPVWTYKWQAEIHIRELLRRFAYVGSVLSMEVMMF